MARAVLSGEEMWTARRLYRIALALVLTACSPACGDSNEDGEGGNAAAKPARGNTVAPTSLEIVLGNLIGRGGEPACESASLKCGDTDEWELAVQLDWSKLSVGNVFRLDEVLSTSRFQSATMGGQCASNPMTSSAGTLEVLSASNDRVSLRVRGTTALPFGTGETLDGEYEVAVCRAQPAEDWALRHAVATTDPTGVISLHATVAQATCADPDGWSAEAHASLVIDLPLVMQAVGTYGLGGHTVAHYETDSAVLDGDDFNRGTITISQIDAEQVHFELSGTGPWFALDRSADGTFVAQRCP